MGFFSRLFGRSDDVPQWARFLGGSDAYRMLLVTVEAELRERGYDVVMGDGVAQVTRPGQEPTSYGIQNLAQVCHQNPREVWPRIVREHFTRMAQSEADREDLDRRARTLDGVRALLRVKLYPASYLEHGVRVPHRRIADDLLAVLAYDLPTSIATVGEDHAAGWGVPFDEVFDIALDNLLAREPVQRSELEVGGGKVIALIGDSFFASSHALFLPDHVAVGRHGALVAVPHRHTVLIHAIEDMGAVGVLNALFGIVARMFEEGPGSVTSSVYWWRPGRPELLRLPVEITPERAVFTPPDEFTAMLNELAEPPS